MARHMPELITAYLEGLIAYVATKTQLESVSQIKVFQVNIPRLYFTVYLLLFYVLITPNEINIHL